MSENKDKMYTFKTIDIKGKKYIPVNERLRFFKEQYPTWTIFTEILEKTPDEVMMRAVIKDQDDKFRAEGLAHEMRSSSMVNKTSYIENCQTSSIGRALGFLGIGITDSIATAEEVLNAITAQEAIKDEPNILLNDIRKNLKNLVDRDFAGKVEKYIEKNNDLKVLKQVLDKVQDKLKGEMDV